MGCFSRFYADFHNQFIITIFNFIRTWSDGNTWLGVRWAI